jgi:hypothetical protein
MRPTGQGSRPSLGLIANSVCILYPIILLELTETVLRQYIADLHEGDLITAQLYMLYGGGPPRASDILGA